MKTLFSILLLIMSLSVSSQTKLINKRKANNIEPLKIGERVPDVSFIFYQNGKKSQSKLSNFYGKTVILIAWATTCTSCIAAMSEDLRLQNEVGEDVKIILITPNSEKEIDDFWFRYRKISANSEQLYKVYKSLPIIKSDSVFIKLFPQAFSGPHVLIDKNQKFIGVSWPSTSTVSNIKSLIAGKPVQFAFIKPEKNIEFNNPLTWIPDNQADIIAYSYLFRKIQLPQFGGTPEIITIKDSVTNKEIGFNVINKGLLDLCSLAFFKRKTPIDHFYYKVADNLKDQFYQPRNTDTSSLELWAEANNYCYALKIPVTKSDSIYSILQNDIQRYFGVKGHFEKQKVKALIIKGDALKLKSKSDNTYVGPIIKSGEQWYEIRRFDMQLLSSIIRNAYNSYPVFNEIKNSNNLLIDIIIPYKLGKIFTETEQLKLKQFLMEYGIEIIEGEREIDVLVLEKYDQ